MDFKPLVKINTLVNLTFAILYYLADVKYLVSTKSKS